MYVVFWSQSGNTEAMANAIAEGIQAAGKEAKAVFVSDISADDLKGESAFALGCPAMGAEVLEEEEMQPFVDQVCTFASGKKIALFGSYGWGDGEWMRDWVSTMEDSGAFIVGDEGLMLNDTPDEDGLEKCRELGKALAAA